MGIMIRETFTNETEGHIFGESGAYESWCETRGEVYRASLDEYGRCISKMYRDVKDAPPRVVGWVFESRDKYGDSRDTYLRHVWVEVLDSDQ